MAVAPAWDPKDEARLRTLWNAGTPIASIATYLGMTRNAIIGKANRLKLPQHEGFKGGGRQTSRPRFLKWPEAGVRMFDDDPRAINDHGSFGLISRGINHSASGCSARWASEAA